MSLAASNRSRRVRDSTRTRDSRVTGGFTLDESHHRPRHPSDASSTIKHIKYDTGSYEGSQDQEEHDHLCPDQTANGTDFSGIQVPEEAPKHLLCEECERRSAVGYCEDCKEALCATCLAILHIPSAGGQPHAHLAQEGIRTLRVGDESAVMREDEHPIPAHEIDEEEVAKRRDLSVPSSFNSPNIDLTSKAAPRNAASPLHAKGDLVVFKASLADSLPSSLCDDDEGDDDCNGRSSAQRASRPRNLYGEVMTVPMSRHGEWGPAGRRTHGHRLLVRVKLLGKASGSYSEPWMEKWLHRKHRREAPREPVQISGGSGADPLAIEISAAKLKDRQRDAVKRTLVLPEHELPVAPLFAEADIAVEGARDDPAILRHGQPHPSATAAAVAEPPRVVLVDELELFTVEEKRNALREKRRCLLEACEKSIARRRRVADTRMALDRWRNIVVKIRSARWEWASKILQRRTRGTLERLALARESKAEEMATWEAGRRLHRQFRYLHTEELRRKAGGGVTTDGRVFLSTKADINRLEALRHVMALRAYRMLCRGVHHAKVRAFKQWLCYTEWERRNSETYLFSVARDASLAEDEVERIGPMHQAGSDSLLTEQVFLKVADVFFNGVENLDKGKFKGKFSGQLYGYGGNQTGIYRPPHKAQHPNGVAAAAAASATTSAGNGANSATSASASAAGASSSGANAAGGVTASGGAATSSNSLSAGDATASATVAGAEATAAAVAAGGGAGATGDGAPGSTAGVSASSTTAGGAGQASTASAAAGLASAGGGTSVGGNVVNPSAAASAMANPAASGDPNAGEDDSTASAGASGAGEGGGVSGEGQGATGSSPVS